MATGLQFNLSLGIPFYLDRGTTQKDVRAPKQERRSEIARAYSKFCVSRTD
jgi:hypothetical protein